MPTTKGKGIHHVLNYNAQGSYTYDDNVSCIPQKNGDLLNHVAIEADFASSRYQIWTRRYVYRKNTKMFVKGVGERTK